MLLLWHMSTIYSSFTSQLITSHFSSILIVFYQFFTGISLGDLDLFFCRVLVRKADGVEEETA